MTEELAAFRSVGKAFGSVRALADVSLSIGVGEVVALIGDNGAGKSTLIKVMSGTVVPDTAEIIFEGRSVRIQSPKEAAALGIATVYQDLALCSNLDVVANMFLGRERHHTGVVDEVEMERITRELLAALEIRPRSLRVPVGSLSGGQRQSVAVARCLLGDPKLIILDEPTAALGVAQKDQVINLILRLKARAIAVLLITHDLPEVSRVADRIEVLRLGRNVASLPGDAAHEEMVAAITGGRRPPGAIGDQL